MANGEGTNQAGGSRGSAADHPWAHLEASGTGSAAHSSAQGQHPASSATHASTPSGPVQVVHVHHYVPVPAQPTYVQHAGPPHNCAYCGGGIVKGRVAENNGIGCVVAILGLFMVPFLIGIPIVLWGAHQAGKARGVWNCRQCRAQMPRQIRWYELG